MEQYQQLGFLFPGDTSNYSTLSHLNLLTFEHVESLTGRRLMNNVNNIFWRELPYSSPVSEVLVSQSNNEIKKQKQKIKNVGCYQSTTLFIAQ